MNRKNAFILIIIPFLMFFANCERSAPKPNELRYGMTTEPKTLDPLDANTADGRSILFNVFEGLVKPGADGKFVPCAAASWTIEENGLIYNFVIREGVRFHDGTVLTCDDVKFSLETAIALKYNGLDLIKEVIIADGGIISVVLKSPDPEYLPFLTVGIVKNGSSGRALNAIGTGPFYIESYAPQRNLILRKFDGYWRRLPPEYENIPYLDKVTIVFHDNFDAMLMSLRAGSIDGMDITGSFISQLDLKEFDVFHSYANGTQLLALNNDMPPFNDTRIRRALTHAIDAQNIIDAAFYGYGTPSASSLYPGLSAYYKNTIAYPYDPEKARVLLSEAGYGEGNPLALEIMVPSNYTMHVDTAQVIANQLSKIGVNAGLKLVDWNTWLEDAYYGRNYQSTVVLLDSSTASPKSFLSRYHSENSRNFINYKSREFDSVFNSILSELDEEERIRLYKEAQDIMAKDAASVFIQDIYYFKAFRKIAGGSFAGIVNYPLYVLDYSVIYWKENN